MTDHVKIFDFSYGKKEMSLFFQHCETILAEGHLTNHTYVGKFEAGFARLAQTKHGLAVSNCTSALHALMLAQGVKGKEVILPTNTFIGAWLAVVMAGGKPVLTDIDPVFLGPSLVQIQEKISQRTSALLTVHIGGIISPEIVQLQSICEENRISLYEDCAHAHLCSWRGVPAGRFGRAGAFSFHLTKVMTTGEGGMIVTDDSFLADKIASIRQFGKMASSPHQFERLGWNMKMTEFQAALGCLELERGLARVNRRQQIAALYEQRLRGSPWRQILPPSGGVSSFYKVILLSPVARSKVEARLRDQNISLTNGVYFTPLHRQKVVNDFEPARPSEFPVSEVFSDSHICPPCYPELSDESIHRICDVLLELAS
jgi:dTDP-4-amino-4,6-dideoxygalactose transaminase